MNAVTDAIKLRLSNHIIGSYVLLWGVYNWRIWLIVFSGSESFELRNAALEKYILSNMFLSSFLAAAISTAIYLFISPLLIELLEFPIRKINLWRERRLNAYQIQLENDKRLGGHIEILANALRGDLQAYVEHAKRLLAFSEKCLDPKDVNAMADFKSLSNEVTIKNHDSSEALDLMKDILNSNYSKSTKDLAREFSRARSSKS